MNTKADFSSRSWKAPNKLKPTQPIIIRRIGLVAFLVAGMGLTASAQSFTNLDFEQATLVPVTGDLYRRVYFGPALPGWTGYCGTDAQSAANYNNEFMDSAGISILDTSYTNEPVVGLTHRRYCVLLQTGISLKGAGFTFVATAIAQTGTVPASAKSIVFNAGLISSSNLTNLVVTFNGTPILLAVITTQTNYVVLGGDVSQFAGQSGELRFTSPILWLASPPRPFFNSVLLDYIRFSSSLPPYLGPTIQTPPQNQTADVGSAVDFLVSADGPSPLAYQWFFNGTNAITGATTSDLHLTNVQVTQSGFYAVVVTNPFAAVTSAPATLTVSAYPPSILTPPVSQTANVRASIDFTVSAQGSPPLSYQWFFNGSPILGASSADLYLPSLQLSQSGTYTVVVTNAFGAVTSLPAMLTVIPIPLSPPTGTVVAWGDHAIPYVAPGTRFTAVAGGQVHSLALKSDGTVVAWGSNGSGESAVPVGLRDVIALAAGSAHSLALESNGTVVAWGSSDYGQNAVPADSHGAIAIAAGYQHNVALKSNGMVVAWGRNDSGQTNVPADLSGVIAIAGGWYHNLALKSDGTVVAWGLNGYGQSTVPPGLSDVVAVAAGGYHSLALKSNGTVVAWGNDPSGGSTVPAGLSNVVAIAAGACSLALKSDGTIVAWGDSSAGESTVPPGLSNVVAIAAGGYHSLALKSDGTIVAWGDNSYGQIIVPASLRGVTAVRAGGRGHNLALKSDSTVVAWGLNDYGQSTVPPGLTNVIAIAAGWSHSLALKSDRTVVAWGAGQATVPAGLHNVIALAAGDFHSLALQFDGTVVAWGDNTLRQSTVPAGLSNVFAIAAGAYHSLALKSDGMVVAWGDNSVGQCTVPLGLRDVIALAAGDFQSLALTSNGTIVVWGDGGPAPVGLRDVIALAGGDSHSLALRSDGTIVAWGDNYFGESTVPAGLSNAFAIAAREHQSLALVADCPILQTSPRSQTAETGSTVLLEVQAAGCPPLTYEWVFNSTIATTGSTNNCALLLSDVQPSQAGAYTVVVTNIAGAVTSPPAMLSVIPPVERRMVPALRLMGQPGSSLNLQDADALGPSPNWATFDNVALTNTSQWYFDLSAPLPPQRFYRVWQPGPSSVASALDLHRVPALTLTGTIGSAVRVDCINQFGPIDAWVTLATVTLTNASQLYFDVSAIGQPARLWRLVPVP